MRALRGFVATFRRALGSLVTGRRLVLVLLLASIPPLLSLAIAGQRPEDQGEGVMAILVFLYLQFLLPTLGLLFGLGLLLDDAESGALSYVFTRPVPRFAVLLGKTSAALLFGGAVLAASLGAMLHLGSAARLPTGFSGRAFAAVLLALPAYVAVFALLSCFTRKALIVGFLYAFGLEGFLTFFPGTVRETTLLFYSRSLLGAWDGDHIEMDLVFGPQGAASPATSAVVLLAVTIVGLTAACVVVRLRQFVPRVAGRD